MSGYDDYDSAPRRRRDDRPPYPAEPGEDFGRRSRPTKADAAPPPLSGSQLGKSDIPPPPLGSAMKREGSRSRAANLKPDFPDEASYLSPRSHDAERKNGDRERRFRDRRNGYSSEEGDSLRSDVRRQRSTRDPAGRSRPSYDEPTRGGAESTLPVRGGPPRDRRGDDDGYDRRGARDDRRRPARDYDDRPRHRRDYDDDETEPPSRRRGPRSGVEYGADPIRPSRGGEGARRDDRRRRDRYDDDSDDEYKPRRRNSQPAPRRGGRSDDDDDYYRRDARDSRRSRRDDDRRQPARRRSHDDLDDDYYDRRDRRDRRDPRDDRDRRSDKRKEPTHMKIGKVDLGPAIDKGQKYYGSLAPILTPIVMNYLKNKK